MFRFSTRLPPPGRIYSSSLRKITRATAFQLRPKCTQSSPKTPCSKNDGKKLPPSVFSLQFWASRTVWNRAGVNTLRCLVGCTLGDFSSMWYLQAFHPDLGTGAIMAISMASGVTTSLLLETVLLRLGRDQLGWRLAAKTAAGMSLLSMVSMELAENLVDYHLTGGVIQLDSPQFWGAAIVSIAAGFLTPLPYNYHRLRKYGKACH
ncbi:hypothetical protein VC83_08327 [Pseudogymnoascus destructans]|uniref:DUF4396 domain-containing protein n=2 Tax=Pseudogymnoascus destructans TaxID=655981 RepID=L8GCY6_PSED2|nr:uncharacterized protein VC83_08327 [Pseudogymnoascus destructans]ELR10694.1 hypothetical protein GMDG_04955 [Pseudogymnoascus destructans 20631-21]OAF55446.1 hypothetical protein VC83_08327 [Pseudogymnoascus destructans]